VDHRIPNTHSPEEVRRAFARLNNQADIIDQGAVGQVLVATGVGSLPAWGTELTSLTKLTVDNITIDGATILSDTGAINFGDENLSTTGSITGGSLVVDNITVDAATITSDTGAISFGDENLSTTGTIAGVNVTSGADPGHTHTATSITLDHHSLTGLGDDDHSQYHTDARAVTWLSNNHESTYNHVNYDTAYSWGDHAGLYESAGAVAAHESTYNHANYDTAYGWGDHAGLYEVTGSIATHAAISDAHHTKYTDAEAITAIKGDASWNATNWDTAYGWGDHALGGYLKADGTVPLSADWTTGAHSIIGSDHWYLRADNAKLFFGAADDAEIYYSGVNLVINPLAVGSGGLAMPVGARFAIGVTGGVSTTENAGCDIYRAETDLTKVGVGIRSDFQFGPSGAGNTTKAMYAFYYRCDTNGSWTGNHTATGIYGAYGIFRHQGSGDLDNAYGANYRMFIRPGAGNITNGYGIKLELVDQSSAGSFGNTYGLQIIGAGLGTSNAFAIHTDGGVIYSAGDVGIGVAAPDEALQVAGNIHVDDNYKAIFGTGKDATIYYDDTNLVIDPDEAGSGKVLIGATADDEIDAGSYSVAGSAGASGTFTTTDGKTVTVTNGITTSIV